MSDQIEVVPTPWYTEEVRALPSDSRVRIDRKLNDLARKGWNDSLADATVKHLRDGIHELRIVGRGAAYRVLFFIAPGRSARVIVLTTCASKSMLKKRQRMDAEIERAVVRRAWWIEQQKRKEDADDR